LHGTHVIAVLNDELKKMNREAGVACFPILLRCLNWEQERIWKLARKGIWILGPRFEFRTSLLCKNCGIISTVIYGVNTALLNRHSKFKLVGYGGERFAKNSNLHGKEKNS